MSHVDLPPDPRSLSKDQITTRLNELTREEQQISQARRGLHDEIDVQRWNSRLTYSRCHPL